MELNQLSQVAMPKLIKTFTNQQNFTLKIQDATVEIITEDQFDMNDGTSATAYEAVQG